jgi:hypothetical protein
MIPEMKRSEWMTELYAARERTLEEGGFKRFMLLAELARGGGLFEAKGLVATITDTPEDNGEGEAILSLLSEFDPHVQVQAKIEELPRLEAGLEEDWSNVLIEELVRFRRKELVQVAIKANPLARLHLQVVMLRILQKSRLRGDLALQKVLREAIEQLEDTGTPT